MILTLQVPNCPDLNKLMVFVHKLRQSSDPTVSILNNFNFTVQNKTVQNDILCSFYILFHGKEDLALHIYHLLD